LEAKSLAVKDTEFIVLPIVTKSENLVCGLDISLYRNDTPGSFVGPSGDLDNRGWRIHGTSMYAPPAETFT
jgi:hypothetical protein